MRICARSFRLPAALAFLCMAPPASAVVTIDWVTVGDPGNACDTQFNGCFGAVGYEYRISKYEVTNTQYTAFLNAVADTDTNALYNTLMGSVASGLGGITRTGSPGSFTYDTIAGREDMPVNWVSFWDATRFANWLHNGQPTGAQDNSTTEDGAYTLTPTGIANNTVTRNVGAGAFVPNNEELYKAAFYDTSAMVYFDYPAGSDTPTTCTAPGATPNTANCDLAVGDLTSVGSYANAASPNGTFDQGGNVREWTYDSSSLSRGTHGEAYEDPLEAASGGYFDIPATNEIDLVGFRVASLAPAAPHVPSLSPLGMTFLWSTLGLFGAAGIRRLRGSQTLSRC